MQVLITGAFGFVGHNLSLSLAAQGHRLVAVDVSRRDLGAYAEFFTWEQMESVDWKSVDAVIHLAGKAHDTRNVDDSQSYFEVNVGLTKTVLEAWKRGVSQGGAGTLEHLFLRDAKAQKKFILFSSVKAAADQVVGVLTEDAVPNPMTPYGKSKLEAEKEVLKFASSIARESVAANDARQANRENFKTYILRPCMIHGPGNKGNLNLLYSVVLKGFPWPLGAFENARSFTSIENLCTVIEALLNTDVPSGVYQMADDETLSTNEVIELMAQSLGREARILRVPPSLVRWTARCGGRLHLPLNSERLTKLTESYVASNAKLKEALGWERMPVRAEEGMRKTLESFSHHGATAPRR